MRIEFMPGSSLQQKINVGLLFAAMVGAQIGFFRLHKEYVLLSQHYEDLIKDYEESSRHFNSLCEYTMYILNTLEKKGVDLDGMFDEFDLIALRNLEPSDETSAHRGS